VYRATRHSWRELPIRLHEIGHMFRAERSGVLSGLQRVRQIALDDTHVFCRPDQVAQEAARGLRSALRAQEILGLPINQVRLSLRDDGAGYLGRQADWDAAEAALRAAGEEVGVALVDAPGEAAFYGPKLDLQVGEDTIATVQLDFQQPERFDLTYDAADGSRPRAVMIHRGTVGSMERVTAALVERYDGRLPLWLAPIQLCLLPVAPAHDDAVRHVADRARAAGLRVQVDTDGSLGSRIRLARQRRATVIGVVGDAEVAGGDVQITDVAADVRASLSIEDALARLASAHQQRAARISWEGESPGPA
jgi:threonyl-tRNA synthetase